MQKFSNTIRIIVFFNQSSNGRRRSNSFRSSSDLENSFTIPNLFRLSKPFLSRFVFIVIDNTLNLATVLQVSYALTSLVHTPHNHYTVIFKMLDIIFGKLDWAVQITLVNDFRQLVPFVSQLYCLSLIDCFTFEQ